MFFLRILSFVISSVFIVSAFPQTSFPAMPQPAGTQYHSYPAAVSASGDDDPANAKPIGVGTVATGANTVRLEIKVGYVAPVDLYFAIYAPGPLRINDLFLLNSNFAFTPFSQSGLVPWKLNVTQVDEAIFGSLSAADLPKGTYTLYLLALPAGTSPALMNDFNLWSTILTVKPGHKFIAAGRKHSLAVTCDGEVYVWGDNQYCECGVAFSYANQETPILLDKLLPDTVEVVGGQYHSLALNSDGTVWAWGNNDNGQLGVHLDAVDGSCAPLLVHGPGNVGLLTGITRLAAGEKFSLALKSDGTLWAWGENGSGQLGINTQDDHTVPYQVHGPGNVGFLTDVVDVAAGKNHTLALKSDGTVYAWGDVNNGQLGIGAVPLVDSMVPNQVHGPGNVGYLSGIIKVAAGGNFSLALKEDGSLWAWGGNYYGQLGINSFNDQLVPIQVHGPGNVGYLTDVVDVAAGAGHTLALKSDGTVYAWGDPGVGQLGIGSVVLIDSTFPYQVLAHNGVDFLSGIIEVAAGYYHSLALRDDGTVWAWGENGNGQLGINTQDDHTVPYQVHGPNDVDYLTGIGPTCSP